MTKHLFTARLYWVLALVFWAGMMPGIANAQTFMGPGIYNGIPQTYYNNWLGGNGTDISNPKWFASNPGQNYEITAVGTSGYFQLKNLNWNGGTYCLRSDGISAGFIGGYLHWGPCPAAGTSDPNYQFDFQTFVYTTCTAATGVRMITVPGSAEYMASPPNCIEQSIAATASTPANSVLQACDTSGACIKTSFLWGGGSSPLVNKLHLLLSQANTNTVPSDNTTTKTITITSCKNAVVSGASTCTPVTSDNQAVTVSIVSGTGTLSATSVQLANGVGSFTIKSGTANVVQLKVVPANLTYPGDTGTCTRTGSGGIETLWTGLPTPPNPDCSVTFVPAGPDHYEIVTPAGTTGINTTAALTVIACANPTCTAPHFTTGSPTITLNTTLQSGTLGTLSSTALTLASGTFALTMSDTAAGVTRVGVAVAGAPAATNPWQCYNGTTRNQTSSCDVTFAATLDHYEIVTPSSSTGINTTAPVSVKACANATCSVLYTAGSPTITLNTTVQSGTLGTLSSTALTLASGTVALTMGDTAPGVTRIGVAVAGAPAAPNPWQCYNGTTRNQTSSCDVTFAATLDHYEIVTPSVTTSTTSTAALTVKACADAACSVLYTAGSPTITLNTTVQSGTIGILSSTALTLVGGTVALTMSDTAPGVTRIGVAVAGAPAAPNPWQCYNGTTRNQTSSCDVTFAATLDHYEIVTPSGTTSTSSTAALTVKACANATCSLLYTTGSPTITLNTTLQSGTIGILSSTALTLASGTLALTMSDTADGVTRIGVAVAGAPAAPNPWQCYNGSTRNQTTSCDVTFAATLDHYEIVTPSGSTSTSGTAALTVKACADSTCSALYTTGSPTITLNTTLQSGTIGTLSSTALTLVNGTVALTMSDTATGVTRIGVAVAGSPAAINPWQCYNGTARNQTSSCDVSFDPQLDHYEIVTPAGTTGINATAALTVKACANASCSLLYPSGSPTITLNTTLQSGTIGILSSTALTLTSGTVALTMSDTGVGVTRIGVAVAGAPAAPNPWQCYNGTTRNQTSSCDVVFDATLDHYEIVTPSTITSSFNKAPLTVSACANTACSVLYTTGNPTITLNTTWISGAMGTLSSTALTLTNGTFALTMSDTAAGVTRIGVAVAGSPAAPNPWQCYNGTTRNQTSSCDVTFFDAPLGHIRFEYDPVFAMLCKAEPITIKACYEGASIFGTVNPTCTPYTGGVNLTPTASSAAGTLTWSPGGMLTINASGILSGVTLADTDDTAAVTLGLTVGTPECYDSSSKTVVDCTAALHYNRCTFDAVEHGAKWGTNLYTKLAGASFPNHGIDLLMGYAGSLNTDYNGSPAVELVIDNTNSTTSISSTSCNSLTALTGVTFTPTNPTFASGQYQMLGVSSANAAAKVRVRIKDSSYPAACSTDSFTIRPAFLSLSSDSGVIVAGSQSGGNSPGFKMFAQAQNKTLANIAGYTGTPSLDTSLFITDSNNIAINFAVPQKGVPAATLSWAGSSNVSPVPPVLSGFSAAATSTGNATGTFYYNDFGTLTLPPYAAVDQTFAGPNTSDLSTSNDQFNGDCLNDNTNRYSNTEITDVAYVGAKYGCFFRSQADVVTTPRFRVDHYDVINKLEATAGCNGVNSFIYMGQPFAAQLDVTAQNADSAKMERLLSTTPAPVPSIIMTATPAGTLTGESGTTGLPMAAALNWPSIVPGGFASGNNATCMTTSCKYIKPTLSSTAPVALTITVSITDDDSPLSSPGPGNIKNLNGSAHTSSWLSSATASANFRYGILKLDNAYGSELLSLYMPVTARYWDGTSWARNTDDSCTKVDITNFAFGNYTNKLSNTNVSIEGIVNASTSSPTSQLSLLNGQASIKFKEQHAGDTGSADVVLYLGTGTAATLPRSCVHWKLTDSNFNSMPNLTGAVAGADMDYLRGNWCGSTAGYTQDPHARITFGIPKSPYLYMREKY